MWRALVLLTVLSSGVLQARQQFNTRADQQRYLRQYTGRIGIASGITTLKGASTNTNDEVNYTLYFGATGDLNFNYFGADLDVYYGTASVDRKSGSQLKEAGMNQFGILGGVRGQLPFFTGPVRWVPKIGLGYGSMSLSLNEDTSGALAAVSNKVSGGSHVSAFYYMAGLEIGGGIITFAGDYSHSFAASGGVDLKLGPALNIDSSNTAFQRLRLGAYLRLLPRMLLGFQYIERKVEVQLPVNLLNADLLSPTQQHFLGTLVFEIP